MLCNQGDEDLENFCSVVMQFFGQGPMPSARNILGLALGLVQNPNEHPTLIKLILLCS